jgi:2-methylcitrate dehydratase
MAPNVPTSSGRPAPDPELVAIADYVAGADPASAEARDTARLCLMDTLGCGFLALRFPECAKHLGPLVPGTVVPNGARVRSTSSIP